MTKFELMAVELLQIPYSNQPLREVQLDKMYAAYGDVSHREYQYPYRMSFWAKMFSRNLAARGLLNDIPDEELREFFMNNLYRSKQIDAYIELQIDHNHVIERPDAETINIYENKRDKYGVNMGKWLNCIYTTIDGLRYIISENEMVFTSVPALQTYIIQSHLETYENIKG